MPPSQLKNLVYEGARKKGLVLNKATTDRLNFELKTIKNRGYCNYFLLYAEIIKVCNQLNLLRTPGRNTSAGSLVNYCLDITRFNPLKHQLIFERFLPHQNDELPDIDIDIPMGAQKLVVKKLREKLSRYQICYIALNVLPNKANKVKVVINKKVYIKHTSGVIIAPDDINIPTHTYNSETYYLSEEPKSDPILKNYKFDLIEQSYLNKLQSILARVGLEYHPYIIPDDDPKVFELFAKGDTDHIFQFDMPIICSFMQKFQPNKLLDLALVNSVFNPNAMSIFGALYFHRYATDTSKIYYSDPVIDYILRPTYGIMCFQEPTMLILQHLCKFDLFSAYKFRFMIARAKTKADKTFVFESLRNLTIASGYPNPKNAEEVIAQIILRMRYVLPKAHSLAYTKVSYWGAYYKVYFRKEFDEVFGEAW